MSAAEDFDEYDNYAGEYDEEAERLEAQAKAARAAFISATTVADHDRTHDGIWIGTGTPPVKRPWWCAICLSPPFTDDDRRYGACSGCSLRERAVRERLKSERASVFGGAEQSGGRARRPK